MIKLLRTNALQADFQMLVKLLDAELAERDGQEHAFYAQFNMIDTLKNVLVLYKDGRAVACGAFKEIAPQTVEIKRMFCLPTYRGKGLATQLLQALEDWAAELEYSKAVLETGLKQAEAIALYSKTGYIRIANYGPYTDVQASLCFEKRLIVS